MSGIGRLGFAVAFFFWAGFILMLLVGVLHGLIPALPTFSYGSSLVVAALYGGFHQAATWPGHKPLED